MKRLLIVVTLVSMVMGIIPLLYLPTSTIAAGPYTFYVDYDNGNDATTATPLGWWSIAYTNGSGTTPIADETATGGSTGSTAKLTIAPVLSTGTWGSGTAAGTMYWYGKSAAFAAETLTFGTGGATCSIAGDFTYCAWKTVTSGATAARIAPGDTIRIKKSDNPVAVGVNATWTDRSKTVTLASAQTKNIDMCESTWSKGGSTDIATVSTSTAVFKEGTRSAYFLCDSSTKTSTLQAYYNITDDNYSAYQGITFWFEPINANIVADSWLVCLCSDNAGAVVVDTFHIPAMLYAAGIATQYWHPLTLMKDGGGNLGSVIGSIALYSDTVAPVNNSSIYVDDFSACTTSGLNLKSLISKSSAAQTTIANDDTWHTIQSINSTTVKIDNVSTTIGSAGQGYSTTGTTPETVALYTRDTIETTIPAAYSTNGEFATTEAGTVSAWDSYEGGYDPVTNEQNGETFLDGQCGWGWGFGLLFAYNSVDMISTCRYYYGIRFNTINQRAYNIPNTVSNAYMALVFISAHVQVDNVVNVNNNGMYGGVYYEASGNVHFSYIHNISSAMNYGIYGYNGGGMVYDNVTIRNCASYAVYFVYCSDDTIKKLTTSYNAGVFTSTRSYNNYVWDLTKTETTMWGNQNNYGDDHVYVYSINDDGKRYMYCDYGYAVSDTTNIYGSDGMAWSFTISNANRVATYKMNMPIARLWCPASENTTITIPVKKDSAAGIGASVYCDGGQLPGLVDTETIAADNDAWQLLSITLLPTDSGYVEIQGRAWYISGLSSAYFDTTFSVYKTDPSNIGSTEATLHGEIDRMEEYSPFKPLDISIPPTTRGFEYDVDSGYPYANTVSEVGSFGNELFSDNISGLTPGELYYYRSYAANPWATVYSIEGCFLTTPEAPTDFIATAYSDYQNNLIWSIGTGSDNTMIVAKKDSVPSNISDGSLIYSGSGSSYSHGGLSEEERWFYRAWSYATEGGISQYSLSSVITTDTTLVRLPSSPTFTSCEWSPDKTYLSILWSSGLGSDDTIIVVSTNGYPTNPEEGTTVYMGSSENCTYYPGADDSEGSKTFYLSAWGSNSSGFSTLYDTISTKGGDVMWAVVLAGIGLSLMGLTLLRTKIAFMGFLAFPAVIDWIAFVVYCHSQSTEVMDTYEIMTYFGVLMAFISVFIPFLVQRWYEASHKPRVLSDEEDFQNRLNNIKRGNWRGYT